MVTNENITGAVTEKQVKQCNKLVKFFLCCCLVKISYLSHQVKINRCGHEVKFDWQGYLVKVEQCGEQIKFIL